MQWFVYVNWEEIYIPLLLKIKQDYNDILYYNEISGYNDIPEYNGNYALWRRDKTSQIFEIKI